MSAEPVVELGKANTDRMAGLLLSGEKWKDISEPEAKVRFSETAGLAPRSEPSEPPSSRGPCKLCKRPRCVCPEATNSPVPEVEESKRRTVVGAELTEPEVSKAAAVGAPVSKPRSGGCVCRRFRCVCKDEAMKVEHVVPESVPTRVLSPKATSRAGQSCVCRRFKCVCNGRQGATNQRSRYSTGDGTAALGGGPETWVYRPWFVGSLSSSEVDAALKERGGDGTWCVRESRSSPGRFVVAVLFRGSVIQIQILTAPSADGVQGYHFPGCASYRTYEDLFE